MGNSFNPIDIEMFTYRTWWFMRSPEAVFAKTYDLIDQVKMPILFIHGELDDVVDPTEPKDLMGILHKKGNKDVELVNIPEAKHDCMENPDATIDAITDWISKKNPSKKK